MTLNLHNYMDADGLFVKGFSPLRKALNAQAETLRDDHKAYSPWILRTAKGGTAEERFLKNHDVSLYRHCMDISIIAFMLFVHAWQNDKLTGLPATTAEDDAFLLLSVRRLFAIAFCHDANKYPELSTPGNPTLEQVQEIHDALDMEKWAELPVKTLFAAAATVQQDGQGSALFQGALLTDPLLKQLRNMVRVGDALTSIGSKDGLAAMLASYNKRLAENDPRENLRTLFNLPAVPQKLVVFRYAPVILHRLQREFILSCYEQAFYPLVCLLEGQQLYLSIPADKDQTFLAELLGYLQDEISERPQPQLKRSPTNGEVKIAHIGNAQDLSEALMEKPERGLLSAQMPDWGGVQSFVQEWWQDANSSALLLESKPAKDKGVAPLFALKGDAPRIFHNALVVAAALRMETNKKQFETRLQRLLAMENLDCKAVAGAFDFNILHKNTVQTLLSLQAARHIQDDTQLEEIVTALVGEFPTATESDPGSEEILRQLKQQCGLATSQRDDAPYQPEKKGGTCLLCGNPSDMPIETSRMNLAGIKKTAFNNRIGHRKHIWSQSDANYLCPACIKNQDLLCQLDPKLRSEPLLAAVPFRGLITPVKTHRGDSDSGGTVRLVSSFEAVKPDTWRNVLPWNLDLSDKYPFVSESIDPDLLSVVSAVERWAKYALHSGNPVHVFISNQRDCKPAFVFEQMPALIQELVKDLVKDSGTDTGIRRDQLAEFIKRLELFRQILGCNAGREVLSVMPAFKWWAVAWLNLREEEKKTYLVRTAKESYPMTECDISGLVKLAKQIQTPPFYNKKEPPSLNERQFALKTAMEQMDSIRRREAGCMPSEEETIAAMAQTLAESLNRRQYARGKDGKRDDESFYMDCKAFADAVYHLISGQREKGQFDARFHRFLLAAYTFMFMEKDDAKPEADS